MQDKAGTDLGNLLNAIKSELVDYVNLRMKWLKLESQEQLGKLVSLAGYAMVVTITVTFVLFFASIGLALCVGELIGSMAGGFAILCLLALVVLLLVVLFRKSIKACILNQTIKSLHMLNDDDNYVTNDGEQTETN